MTRDYFRPHGEPARTLYDAFQAEACNRDGRCEREWQWEERRAVWFAAIDYAQDHGLQIPTLAEIERIEELACGHVDYGAKWAYGVAEIMTKLADAAEGKSC